MTEAERRPKRGRGRGGGGLSVSTGTEEQDGKTSLGPGVQPVGGGIFKSAAVAVLRQERKLMSTGEITRVALERGLIKCQGKTPEATMASALYTDVKRKHEKSVFTRPQEGLFGLREWIDEGFYPEGWAGPSDGLGVAPFKKRGGASGRGSRTTPGRAGRGRGAAAWKRGSDDEDVDMEDVEGDEEDEDEDGDEDFEDAEEGEAEGADAAMTDGGAAAATVAVAPAASEPVPVVAVALPDAGAQAAAKPAAAAVAPSPRAASRLAVSSGIIGDTSMAPPPRPLRTSLSGIKDLGGLDPRDDLDSPLHVLGDAVLGTEGRRKPKRDRSFVQVPSGTVNVSGGGGAGASTFVDPSGAITPRSPYEDSLAALHEIATSPNPYAPNGIIDVTGRSRRPRLLLDVSDKPDGPEGVLGKGMRMSNPGGGLNDHKQPPALILNVPLLTPSMGPGFDGMSLPSARGGGGLFSPSTLASIPGLRPGLQDGIQRLEPLISGFGVPMQNHGPSMLPMPTPLDLGAPSQSTVVSEALRLQAVAERLEIKLGGGNPQVSRLWLTVARVCMHAGGLEMASRASHALRRARDACNQLARGAGVGVQQSVLSEFDLLLGACSKA